MKYPKKKNNTTTDKTSKQSSEIEHFKNTIERAVGKTFSVDEESFKNWYNSEYVDPIVTAPDKITLKSVKILSSGDKIQLKYEANYEVKDNRTRDNYKSNSFTVELKNGQDMPFDYEFSNSDIQKSLVFTNIKNIL